MFIFMPTFTLIEISTSTMGDQPVVSVFSSANVLFRSLSINNMWCLGFSTNAELHIPMSIPPTLCCDNVGATALASNLIFHA
jgi:hypothetical protein